MTVYSLLLRELPMRLGRRGEMGGEDVKAAVAVGVAEEEAEEEEEAENEEEAMGTLLLPFHGVVDDEGVRGGLMDEELP